MRYILILFIWSLITSCSINDNIDEQGDLFDLNKWLIQVTSDQIEAIFSKEMWAHGYLEKDTLNYSQVYEELDSLKEFNINQPNYFGKVAIHDSLNHKTYVLKDNEDKLKIKSLGISTLSNNKISSIHALIRESNILYSLEKRLLIELNEEGLIKHIRVYGLLKPMLKEEVPFDNNYWLITQ